LEEVSEGSNWLFVEQGAKKYGLLKPKLNNILNPPPKAPPAGKPGTSTKPGGVPGKKPGKPLPPGSRKDGWWNK
jgi:hypothetical protein